jgi:hypothetical protein
MTFLSVFRIFDFLYPKMQNNDINIEEFVKDRESDIRMLEKAINNSKKKTMYFQRLPFYKRRRTRSNFVKKNKSTRQKHRHILKTHVWYAKRFKMIKVEGIGLPLVRNQKSSKYIYKSQDRGFIFDESFKKIRIYSVNDSIINLFDVDKNVKNLIQLVKSDKGYVEVIVTDLHFILISSLIDFNDKSVIKTLDCCISFIKIHENTIKNISQDIDASLSEDLSFFVRNSEEYEVGKLFILKKDVMDMWGTLIKKGCIPVSIDEVQRLALENSYMTYPFDDVNSVMFRCLENVVNTDIMDKYERTPKSKKVEINSDDLFINTNKEVHFYAFELEKGVLTKNGLIFSEKDDILGRVIRGGFCYTRGRSRGLCYLYKECNIEDKFIAKNYNHENRYELRIIKHIK